MNESKVPVLTLKELNDRFGDYGQTFSSKEEAEAHSKKFPGSWVYKLVNHTSSAPGDYKETSRHCIAWLVSKTDKNKNPIPQRIGRR